MPTEVATVAVPLFPPKHEIATPGETDATGTGCTVTTLAFVPLKQEPFVTITFTLSPCTSVEEVKELLALLCTETPFTKKLYPE